MCFRRQWLCKMWLIQLAFLLFTACMIFLSLLTICNTSFFSHDWSNWCPPTFSSTFQNFPGISDARFGVSKSQPHTKLCSTRSNLLTSSIHILSLNKRVQEYQSALSATNEGRWHKTALKWKSERCGSRGRRRKRRNHVRGVFLNRRAAARYRALASIIPGRERFSWNLSF